MDVIAFLIEQERDEAPEVVIHIDGEPLVDLARAVELPFATRERTPHLAGDYTGLGADTIGPEATYFLEGGSTTVMGCGCGEPACWPLVVDIEVTAETVTWANFRNGFRPWDLSGLGPFVFDARQYAAALGRGIRATAG